MKTLLFTGIFFLTGLVFASEKSQLEFWDCHTYFNSTVVVKLVIDENRQTGAVYASGKLQDAIYRVDGLNHRWDFGTEETHYSFIISPTGRGQLFRDKQDDVMMESTGGSYICENVISESQLNDNDNDNDNDEE